MAQKRPPLRPAPTGTPCAGSVCGGVCGPGLVSSSPDLRIAAGARRQETCHQPATVCTHKSATVLTACVSVFPLLWSVRAGIILCVLWCGSEVSEPLVRRGPVRLLSGPGPHPGAAMSGLRPVPPVRRGWSQ